MKHHGMCPVNATLEVIAGRWKTVILFHLFPGTKRFSELLRSMHPITQKMLTQQLRELERDGVVHRKVYPQVPPKVEYSLTALGASLKPVVDEMCKWGLRRIAAINRRQGQKRENGKQKIAPSRESVPAIAVN